MSCNVESFPCDDRQYMVDNIQLLITICDTVTYVLFPRFYSVNNLHRTAGSRKSSIITDQVDWLLYFLYLYTNPMCWFFNTKNAISFCISSGLTLWCEGLPFLCHLSVSFFDCTLVHKIMTIKKPGKRPSETLNPLQSRKHSSHWRYKNDKELTPSGIVLSSAAQLSMSTLFVCKALNRTLVSAKILRSWMVRHHLLYQPPSMYSSMMLVQLLEILSVLCEANQLEWCEKQCKPIQGVKENLAQLVPTASLSED